jgi:hypothetical protein
MKKTRAVKQETRGRPRTGITPLMGFRADPVIRAAIVKWAEYQPDKPSLSEAIRRLVELGLYVKTKPIRRTAASADRAKELAAKAIDNLVDPAAPADEKASRKRRLLKGPEEFHDVRVDRAKKK